MKVSLLTRLYFYMWNLWPPWVGAGITINKINPDMKYVRMKLKRRPWSRNLVGTQFGGSMFSMTDPIFMSMFMVHLGKGFIVWDKSAQIRFRKPGKTTLYAEFVITDDEIADVKKRVLENGKIDWEKEVFIKDPSDQIIAEVKKIVHIKKK